MASFVPLASVDDEDFALQLQIEELEAHRKSQTGKWAIDRPPDFILAVESFGAELKRAISTARDVKVARSIARAVVADAEIIQHVSMEETKCAEDRILALSLDQDENLLSRNLAGLPEASQAEAEPMDLDIVSKDAGSSTFSAESCSSSAGPTYNYPVRQKAVLEHPPQPRVNCSVCGDAFHPRATVRLDCGDIYCRLCLKTFFLRVIKDETLFPPTCHRQAIDFSIIQADFSVEELAAYRNAEQEFSSTDRVYCANADCTKFIPLSQRTADRASCEACRAETCTRCKALAHGGECGIDEAKQSLLDFATEQGWRSCFGCGEMVFRYEGCDHITCRCRAEFCYRCGTKWKECACGDWEPELLDRRAQQIVDREAIRPLMPVVRRQRVAAMAEELLEVHECNHRGKFMRLEGLSRHGRACEMCGTRHRKYILSCRSCHMLACEDCRRYRCR